MRNLALRNLAIILLAAAATPMVAGDALAQEQSSNVKIGVTVSAVINAKPHVGPRVSAALGKALGETLSAQVLAGPDAQARLPEAARSETCLGESSCLVSAGKALGVDQLLMLIIVGVGDELKIEATWVDVATGETALRAGITTADTDDAMRAAFQAKASELLPTVSLRPSETTSPKTVTPLDPETANPLPIEAAPAQTASKSSAPSLLMIGGAAMLGASVIYGGYQFAVDCEFAFGECQSSDKGGVNTAFDIVGAVGIVALSAGAFMYFTGSDEAAKPSPVALNVGSESFRLSYGGRF